MSFGPISPIILSINNSMMENSPFTISTTPSLSQIVPPFSHNIYIIHRFSSIEMVVSGHRTFQKSANTLAHVLEPSFSTERSCAPYQSAITTLNYSHRLDKIGHDICNTSLSPSNQATSSSPCTVEASV